MSVYSLDGRSVHATKDIRRSLLVKKFQGHFVEITALPLGINTGLGRLQVQFLKIFHQHHSLTCLLSNMNTLQYFIENLLAIIESMVAQESEIFSLIPLFALAISCALIARHRVEVLVSQRRSRKTNYDTAGDIRALIAARNIVGRGTNGIEPLRARSLANEHLRRKFGIENAFTTADRDYANNFVKKAGNLINISASGWNTIFSASEDVVWRWREEAQDRCECDNFQVEILSLIRAVTLYAVLTAFFFINDEKNLRSVPLQALNRLAWAINETWMMSKSEDPFFDFTDNEFLQDALRDVLPLENISNPRENPLNFILPGFETMWRVVLRGFIEVAYKTGKEHPTWREALVEYFPNPTIKLFNKTCPPDGVSASYLVKETLRLYPPTKRVYRGWQDANSSEPTKLAGDIEAVHHSTNVWGRTAKEFDPLRWKNVTREQEAAFLAFGSKPFECPAKPTFGPRLVGLLIGILLEAFPDDCKLVSSTEEVEFGPGLLSNDRSGWEDVYLLVPNN
jgi:dihydroceramidase